MPSLKAREMLVREVIWGRTGGKAANWDGKEGRDRRWWLMRARTHARVAGWGVFGGMAKVGG